MERFTKVLVLVAVLGLGGVVACEHGHDTVIDGPVPVVIQQDDPIQVVVVQDPGVPLFEAQCEAECSEFVQDCGWFYLCEEQPLYSEMCGTSITRCVPDKCAVFEDGWDSCPDGYACDTSVEQCRPVEGPAPECLTDADCEQGYRCNADGVCEWIPVVVEPELVELRCCYDYLEDGVLFYGQMSWSESEPDQPEAWGALRDREIDEAGCFSGLVNPEKVKGNFWADLTVGKAEEMDWMGPRRAPSACWINTIPARIYSEYTENRGWGFCL